MHPLIVTEMATTAAQPTPSATTMSEAPPPNVTIFKNGGAQIAGENYTLTCQVTGGTTAMPIYQWFKNGSLLANRTSATLSFLPLMITDSGVYTCEGTRNSTTSSSGDVMITVDGKF